MSLSRSTPLAMFTLLMAGCAAAPVTTKPCSEYCQTQQDGYEWAQRAMLLDAKVCEGYAPAFVLGCRQSVQDYAQSKSPREGW